MVLNQSFFWIHFYRGATLEGADHCGQTALHLASKKGHATVVRILLERGANVDVSNNLGMRPIHFAAERGMDAVVTMLASADSSKVDVLTLDEKSPVRQLYSS